MQSTEALPLVMSEYSILMVLPALCASTISPERVKARMTNTREILNPSRNSISALVWICFV